MCAFGHSIRHRKIHTGFRLQFCVYLEHFRRSIPFGASHRQTIFQCLSLHFLSLRLTSLSFSLPSLLSLPFSLTFSPHLINRRQKWYPAFANPVVRKRKQSLRINHLLFHCRCSRCSFLMVDPRRRFHLPM